MRHHLTKPDYGIAARDIGSMLVATIIFEVMIVLCYHVKADDSTVKAEQAKEQAIAKAEVEAAVKVYHYTEGKLDIKILTLVDAKGRRSLQNITITKIDGSKFSNMEMVNAVKYCDAHAIYKREYPKVGLWESEEGITYVTSKEVEHRRHPEKKAVRPVGPPVVKTE